jgi:type I restriction enzyme, R subunit
MTDIMSFSESVIGQAALVWLESLGYTVMSGLEIAPGESQAERESYGQVVLERRLRQTLQRLNPEVPADTLDEAFHKLTRLDRPSLVANNHVIHKYLVEGVPVEYQRPDGSIGGDLVRVLDYDDPEANDFLAVNQFTVVENRYQRRPDVVLFVNGLPLAVMELKNAATEIATIWTTSSQLQTYKQQIPSLFAYNEDLVISDGLQARIGTLTADREWFMPWPTIEGEELADTRLPQLQVVLEGVFDKRRFLELIRHFIVFEDVGGGVFLKKMAGYHQYHALNLAVHSTVQAAGEKGDRRVGVVWHTQGSGKSLTMAFYTGRVVLHPAMENPTLVVITDRNDLDDQLYGTVARCHELLRQPPVQAQSRADRREKLRVGSGGVVFTTVQKFFFD